MGGYPVEYQATLVVDQAVGLWAFDFSATDAVQTVQHIVDGPMNSDRGTTNGIVLTEDRLDLDFFRFASRTTSFDLMLDFQSEAGSWNWNQDCPVCDLLFALPSATATISSIRVVPEPHSSVVMFIIGSIIALSFRHHRT